MFCIFIPHATAGQKRRKKQFPSLAGNLKKRHQFCNESREWDWVDDVGDFQSFSLLSILLRSVGRILPESTGCVKRLNVSGQALCGPCRDETHASKMFRQHDVIHMSKKAKELHRKVVLVKTISFKRIFPVSTSQRAFHNVLHNQEDNALYEVLQVRIRNENPITPIKI